MQTIGACAGIVRKQLPWGLGLRDVWLHVAPRMTRGMFCFATEDLDCKARDEEWYVGSYPKPEP